VLLELVAWSRTPRTPAKVADLAAAILGNGFLTGQVLLLDGGLHPT
jgi:hypothetical protein